MKVRVLGCHGSDQVCVENGVPVQRRTSCLLINGMVAVDSGGLASSLRLEEQYAIRHVLLSHLHFDHIQGLPSLADNRVGAVADPVEILSIAEVLDGLRAHIFNWKVYPNFFELPSVNLPVFRSRALAAGKESDVAGLRVTPIRVNHQVPTVGYLIREGNASLLYSGDTYETDEICKVAANEPTLKAVVIETSFPNEMSELARISYHLTPELFGREFRKIGRPDLPVYVFGMKPRVRQQIGRELDALGIAKLTMLRENQEIVI